MEERKELITAESAAHVAKVYAAIVAVQGDVAKIGISKDRKNQSQGYAFRGIDDVYGTLAPILAKNSLCILPRMVERECVERQTAKGGALFYVTVTAEFDFVSAEDGSKHTVRTYGEAMDSADKATNKAMSAAYKYACFQAFCVPTEGDNDADATTHEVKPEQPTITITPHQENELHALITDHGLAPQYLQNLCSWLGVETLADLPAKDFNKAKSAINDAIKKAGKK